MKKLMMAAAVAAMVGGAFADGYDFTASVKTTTGRSGTQKTTYTVNCGMDAQDGTYWWDGAGYASDKEAKKDVAAMSNDEKRDFAINTLGYDEATGICGYNWPEYYRNKARWCYTFKYTTTDTECYRVSTSRKLTGIVEGECCDAWEFISADFDLADDTIAFGLFYRFNGVTLAKSTKVEVAGTIGGSFDGTAIGTWAIAGQGAYDVKNDVLKSISGNIVGVLDNPDCESCCDYNTDAIVYACDSDPVSDPQGTAAYGTWSIKYNKKYN